MRILADVYGDTPKEAAAAMRELADRVETGEEVARANYQGRGYECEPFHAEPKRESFFGWNEDSRGTWHFHPRWQAAALCGRMRTGGGFKEHDPKEK